jgi:predicted HD phosphohydrolase
LQHEIRAVSATVVTNKQLRPRYSFDGDGHDSLSEDSKRSLTLQGGIFSRKELEAFQAKPFAAEAMRVRRWDDCAKVPGAATPPIGHYLEVAASCAVR